MAREGLENPRGRQLMLNLPVICSKCYLIQYQNSHYALFSWPLDLLFFPRICSIQCFLHKE